MQAKSWGHKGHQSGKSEDNSDLNQFLETVAKVVVGEDEIRSTSDNLT